MLCLTTLMLPGITVSTAAPAGAGEKAMAEYEVKAVYLLNLGKFTQWPQTAFTEPEQELVLGLFGEDVFGEALELITAKKIQGRRLIIKKLGKGGDPRGCHILFISASEKRRLKQILSLLADQPVLTVSDMSGFAEEGGMIGLKEMDNKINIIINVMAAKEAGLILRSQLLNISTIINKDNPLTR